MTVFVGVDGGGTTTRAVVVDAEGHELARVDGEGSVVTAHEPERATRAVDATVRRAAARAGVQLPVSALWAGLAGAGGAPARAAVTRELRGLDLARRLAVGTDVEAAFHAAFGDAAGLMLVAGTGSIVWARDPSGDDHRVGGWGHVLGDEGSGYWIGIEALRRLMRAVDGRDDPTALTELLVRACGVDEATALVSWVEDASKAAVAALAPKVVRCADEGDEAASAIVHRAVMALCAHVEAGLAAVRGAASRSVGSAGPRGHARAGSDLDVVLWGGLVAPGGPLEGRTRLALADRGIHAIRRSVDPAMGAASLARRLAA